MIKLKRLFRQLKTPRSRYSRKISREIVHILWRALAATCGEFDALMSGQFIGTTSLRKSVS